MVLTPARVSLLREERGGFEWQLAQQQTVREARDASAWKRWSRAPSLCSEGKKGDLTDEAACVMVRQARRQLPRRLAAEGGGTPPPPHLLLQDLMAQQTVEFGDFHLFQAITAGKWP